MNEPHQRFHDWLTAGADGEPPRDAAVHASVCAACRQSIAALDLLAIVNTGLAAMPAEPTGREHGRLVMVGRLMGATAVLLGAAILGVGVSQLVGVSPGGGPVAQASATPEQSVLAETATPQSIQPAPGPSAAQETLTPVGTPGPTHAPPAVTPFPRRTAAPTPIVTPIATPVATPIPTASGTPVESTVPTPTPTPTPTPSASESVPSASESVPSASESVPSASESVPASP
jgi:hypothetical protein